jgi:regulator of RNase E activity RraA
VLVVDGGGDVSQAAVGGLMRTTALVRRLGGFVIDGAIRDVAEWAEGGLPCYARAVVHRGPSKEGPGEINVPIACAGMVVMPGDLMLGDADGVICIPADRVRDLLPLVKAIAARENKQREAILANTTDPDRFDAILRSKGIPAELLKRQ